MPTKITPDALADLLVQSGSVPGALGTERARMKQYIAARQTIARARSQRQRTGRGNADLLADAARIRRDLAEASNGRCLATVFVTALRWEAQQTDAAFGLEPPRFTYRQAVQAVRAADARLRNAGKADGQRAVVAVCEAAEQAGDACYALDKTARGALQDSMEADGVLDLDAGG